MRGQKRHGLLKDTARCLVGLSTGGGYISPRLWKVVLGVMLLLLLVLIGVRLWQSYHVLFAEIREMANITAILHIRNGTFNDVHCWPGNIYLYGCLQAWLLSFLPAEWNPILLNRLFTWLCLLASDAVLVLSIKELLQRMGRRMSRVTELLAASLYLLPHLFQMPSTLGTPNYLGLLLANITLYCSIRVSKANLFLLPLLLTGCFMTKQYFLYSGSYVLLGYYLLHKGIRPWWEFAVICLLSGIGIALCFLLDETCYALHHHLNMRSGYLPRGKFLRRYALYLCFISPLLWVLYKEILLCCWKAGNRWQDWKKLLQGISRPVLFALSGFVLSALLMVRMGQHCGAIGIMYFPQLMGTPSILLLGVVLGRRQHQRSIAFICSLLITAMTGTLIALALRPSPYSARVADFAAAAQQDFSNPTLCVRGSALSSYIELPLRGRVDDNGQTCYLETVYPHTGNFWLGEYRQRAEEMKGNFLAALRGRVYDVMYVDSFSYSPEGANELILEGYEISRHWQFDPNIGVTRYIRRTDP